MYKFLEELKKDIDEKSFDKIVADRLIFLASEEYKKETEIISETSGIITLIKGFIPKDKKILFAAGLAGAAYVYDDEECYITLLSNIKELKDKKNKPIDKVMLEAVANTVHDYFGKELSPLFSQSEDWKNLSKEEIRECYNNCFIESYKKDNGLTWENMPDFVPVSIKETKGLGFAMCSEHAALTQQLFSFLGIESYYVGNNMIIDGKEAPHAYNLIKNDSGDSFVIDILNNNTGKVESEKVNNLLQGKTEVLAGKYHYGNVQNKDKDTVLEC